MIVIMFTTGANVSNPTQCRLVLSGSKVPTLEMRDRDALGAERWGAAPALSAVEDLVERLLALALSLVVTSPERVARVVGHPEVIDVGTVKP